MRTDCFSLDFRKSQGEISVRKAKNCLLLIASDLFQSWHHFPVIDTSKQRTTCLQLFEKLKVALFRQSVVKFNCSGGIHFYLSHKMGGQDARYRQTRAKSRHARVAKPFHQLNLTNNLLLLRITHTHTQIIINLIEIAFSAFNKFKVRLTHFRLISQYQGQCDRKVSPQKKVICISLCLQKFNHAANFHIQNWFSLYNQPRQLFPVCNWFSLRLSTLIFENLVMARALLSFHPAFPPLFVVIARQNVPSPWHWPIAGESNSSPRWRSRHNSRYYHNYSGFCSNFAIAINRSTNKCTWC